MASWKEIDRIRKDPKGFRALAKGLHKHIGELTDWEKDFLSSIVSEGDKDEYTTRQSEKLLQIRDDYESVTETRDGFSVKILLQQCKVGRLDLSEDDDAWIFELCERNYATIRRKNVGRLLRCARELHLIEDEFAA